MFYFAGSLVSSSSPTSAMPFFWEHARGVGEEEADGAARGKRFSYIGFHIELSPGFVLAHANSVLSELYHDHAHLPRIGTASTNTTAAAQAP